MRLVALLAALAVLLHAPGAAAWHQCSAQGTFSGPYGYQAIGNLSDFKTALLTRIWPYTHDASKELGGWGRYDTFNPFIACPPNQPLRRVGSSADGGKIICDVGRLPPPCVIYSLGSNGDYSFEQEMLNLTQCEIHTFDCTFDGRSLGPRHKYHKTCLGSPANGATFKDYDTITRELGHNAVDFLKMDIEGHEPSVLQSLVSNRGSLPRQMTIEMHMRVAVGAVAPVDTVQMSILFYHLANLGYGVVSREDNLWGVRGCCAEFTFLHVEQQHRHQRLVPVLTQGSASAVGKPAPAPPPDPAMANAPVVSPVPSGPGAQVLPGVTVVMASKPVETAAVVDAGEDGLGPSQPQPLHFNLFGRLRRLRGLHEVAGGAAAGGEKSAGAGRHLLTGSAQRWGTPSRWAAVGTWAGADGSE